MARLTISNVVKSYGAVEVLHGISISAKDGEFVTLVGPSGCGKSTLLRTIAGLEDISGGEIRIGERLVNGLEPKDRDIAMVFQSYALYPHMTVRNNMSFALRLSGQARADIDAAVKRAAEILGLEALLDRFPRQLSGGQRQRVAMGRAIVRNPAIFLFDEPLSNLDAKLRVQMRAEIKALHRRLGASMVYVTHDQMEAMTMADRIVVMNGGRVEQIGSPLEIYDNPASRFVATFIGSPSMNMVKGMVAGQGAPELIGEDDRRWPLPEDAAVHSGARIELGIRPEHLLLDPDGIEATVVSVDPTGAETHVELAVGDNQFIGVFRDRLPLVPGETMRFSYSRSRVHLFDAETGSRL